MLKKINEIFGYMFFSVGALKILLVILVLLKLGTSLTAIFTGGQVETEYFSNLTMIVGFAETVLVFGSIIMIIINIKKQPEVISGYFYGLGAILLEIIIPNFMSIYFLIPQCSMLMKAGSKIRKTNNPYETQIKTTKKMIKNTDWFYSDKEQKINKNYLENKSDELKKNIYSEGIDNYSSNEDIIEDAEKEKFNTMLLIAFIAIISLVICIFLYIIIVQNSNENVVINEAKGNIDNSKETEKQTQDDSNSNQINNKVQSGDETLSEIVNIFNSSNATEKMRLQGYTMDAVVQGDEIIVFSSGDGLSFNIKFVVENGIIYSDIMYNETDSRITFIEITLGIMLLDSIGQMKGYPDGAIISALGKDEAINYTIDKEGFEIRLLDNGQGITVRADLNSDFSFLNEYEYNV